MSASATASPGYYYNPPLGERLNERKDSTASSSGGSSKQQQQTPQVLENPLLRRDAIPSKPQYTPHHHHQSSELRQRRPSSHSNNATNNNHSNLSVETEKENQPRHEAPSTRTTIHKNRNSSSSNSPFCLPPKASYSLGTMGNSATHLPFQASPRVHASPSMIPRPATSGTGVVPCTRNAWVLVYGFATEEQAQEVLRRLATYGQVLEHVTKAPHANWMAVHYAHEWQAKKALCHARLPLSDHVWIGVTPLADDDPLLQGHASSSSSSLATTTTSLWGPPVASSSATMSTSSTTTTAATALSERDILLRSSASTTRTTSRNVCTRVMQWVLGIPPDQEQDE